VSLIARITALAQAVGADIKSLSAGKVDKASVGIANGIAGLDSGGLVPATQLPSYLDDVLEYATFSLFPATGETGKIYICDTPYTQNGFTSSQFRWSGSAYVAIVASPGSTDSVTEGSTNLYFTGARVLATVLAGLSVATSPAITATDTVLSGLGKLQAQITAVATTLAANVRGTVLTGFVTTTNAAVLATDTVLVAFGKLQAQLANYLPLAGGKLTGALNLASLVTVASATTTPIGAAASNAMRISGTTTITAFDSIADGAQRQLIFQDALTLTHSATALILPGAANITTAAGDTATFLSIGSGNWRCTSYIRQAVAPASTPLFTREYTLDTSYTNGGAITLSHGLGVVPKFAQFQAVCLTDEGGWSAGLVMDLSHEAQFAGSPTNAVGFGAAFNNVTLFVRIAAAGLYGINYGTQQAFALTPSSWSLRVKVWG
jgi:hypothetical protein